MKHALIVCIAGLAFAATAAQAQNDTMSKPAGPMSAGSTPMAKDAMGHDAMSKDDAMKKGMKKHTMKKDAMSHDSMGKPMKSDKGGAMSN